MSEYAVARLEDIDEISDGREPWRPVRHHCGITSFGINAWTGREAGDRIINEHDEEGEDEELYFVQSGRARFELDGECLDAPAGTFVFARPGVKRTAFAEQPQTTILAVGATPGRAYQPTGWELWAPAGRLYQERRYAEAADQARDLAEAQRLRLIRSLQVRARERGRLAPVRLGPSQDLLRDGPPPRKPLISLQN